MSATPEDPGTAPPPAPDRVDHYTDGRPCWCMPRVETLACGEEIVIHNTVPCPLGCEVPERIPSYVCEDCGNVAGLIHTCDPMRERIVRRVDEIKKAREDAKVVRA